MAPIEELEYNDWPEPPDAPAEPPYGPCAQCGYEVNADHLPLVAREEPEDLYLHPSCVVAFALRRGWIETVRQ